MAANTDKLRKTKANTSTTLASGISDSDTTIACSSLSGIPADTAIMFTIDRVDANGVATPSLMEGVVGVVSGNNITTATRGVEGSAQSHGGGAVVEILWTADNVNDIVDWGLAEHNQDGTHKAITTPSVTASGPTADEDLTLAGKGVGATLDRAGCYLSRLATQSINNTTDTVISWDSEKYDPQGMYAGGSPTRITIPQTGLYEIKVHIQLASNTTGYRASRFLINGSVTSPAVVSHVSVPASGNAQIYYNFVWSLTATNYVEFDVWQNSGGALAVNFASISVKRIS